VSPHDTWVWLSAQGLLAPAPSVRVQGLQSTKTGTDYFLPNHFFIAKCIPVKRQSRLFPVVLATHCGKGSSAIALLQSTVLCV